MDGITLQVRADALDPVREAILANVPAPLPEDGADALAARVYNATLADALQTEADDFANEYDIPCFAEPPCGRVLTSPKHAGHHITRKYSRDGVNATIQHIGDGHTSKLEDDRTGDLGKAWATRATRAQSAARKVYETVAAASKA